MPGSLGSRLLGRIDVDDTHMSKIAAEIMGVKGHLRTNSFRNDYLSVEHHAEA